MSLPGACCHRSQRARCVRVRGGSAPRRCCSYRRNRASCCCQVVPSGMLFERRSLPPPPPRAVRGALITAARRVSPAVEPLALPALDLASIALTESAVATAAYEQYLSLGGAPPPPSAAPQAIGGRCVACLPSCLLARRLPSARRAQTMPSRGAWYRCACASALQFAPVDLSARAVPVAARAVGRDRRAAGGQGAARAAPAGDERTARRRGQGADPGPRPPPVCRLSRLGRQLACASVAPAPLALLTCAAHCRRGPPPPPPRR